MGTSGHKRGHGEGSIARRPDGRWEGRLSLPGGRRKSVYGETRQEAQRKLAAVRRDMEAGLPVVAERQTVAGWADQWLEMMRPRLRPRTWVGYGQYLRRHVVPTLGEVRVARLTPTEVQALYAAKLGEGLSPTTVHHLHAVLHRMLETALRHGVVARNVCDQVERPRMAEREMRVLSPEEAARFLDAARGDRLEALYVLALATGMRAGELLGLKWEDIDWEDGSLRVRRSLAWVGEGYAFGPPKTQHGKRRVSLRGAALGTLRAHRGRQAAERLRAGEVWAASVERWGELVFPNTIGGPLDGGHLTQRFLPPVLARAGLPPMRFHDLRHTAATLLLGRRVPTKVVSEMLGHATSAITADLYQHVVPDIQDDAAQTMDALLRGWGVGESGEGTGREGATGRAPGRKPGSGRRPRARE